MQYFADRVTGGDCDAKPKEIETMMYSERSIDSKVDKRVRLLNSVWGALLNKSLNGKGQLSRSTELGGPNVPNAPHLENCKLIEDVNKRLDKLIENERSPPWTIWKGMLTNYPFSTTNEQLRYPKHQPISESANPPWVCF